MTATAKPLSLYELGSEYESLLAAIEANGGEVTPELELQLAAIDDAMDVKAERCALVIRNLEGLAEAAAGEAVRLLSLAAARKSNAEALKKMLQRLMELTGKAKIVRPLATVSIVNNGGVLPVTWNGPPVECPAPYRTETLSYGVDRAKVLAAHEAGVVLPVGLSVGERGKRLSIK